MDNDIALGVICLHYKWKYRQIFFIVAQHLLIYLWLQVRDWETRKDWYRSKSTTLLHSDEEEGVNSCSTLSDEDSTPHVSR